MTKKQLAACERARLALERECHTGDTEADHAKADTVLVQLLREHEAGDVADAYEEVAGWYG